MAEIFTLEEVANLIRDFYNDFCEGTGLEELREEWIKNNVI